MLLCVCVFVCVYAVLRFRVGSCGAAARDSSQDLIAVASWNVLVGISCVFVRDIVSGFYFSCDLLQIVKHLISRVSSDLFPSDWSSFAGQCLKCGARRFLDLLLAVLIMFEYDSKCHVCYTCLCCL